MTTIEFTSTVLGDESAVSGDISREVVWAVAGEDLVAGNVVRLKQSVTGAVVELYDYVTTPDETLPPYGIVLTAATAGNSVPIVIAGMIPNSITGLLTAATSDPVTVSSAGLPVRNPTYLGTDWVIGIVDTRARLILSPPLLGTMYADSAVTVETVAALRAKIGHTGQTVRLKGYAAAGDGGEGDFYWSASAATDNSGTIFNSGGHGTSAAGWRRSYTETPTVKWFGATGDGVTDDTTAIQRAINFVSSTLRLRIPAGVYRITSSLAATNAGGTEFYGMTIAGDVESPVFASSSGAALYWDGNTTDPMFKAHAPGMTIRGLVFRVAAGKTTVCAIDWDKPAGGLAQTALTVEFCDIDPLSGTMTYGIRVGAAVLSTTNLEYMAVDRCTFTRQTEAGIYIPNTSGQSKLHNITRSSFTYAKSGIRIKTGSARIHHCNFGRLTQCAVEVDSPTDFISMVDIDTEDCTRFLDTFWDGGASSSPWTLKIDGLRAGITENLAADGYYVRVTHPGIVDLSSIQFEYNVTNSDLDPDSVKIAVWSSVEASVSSRGCLYLGSEPWSRGAGVRLHVNSENDWAKTFVEAPPGTWSATGYVRIPMRTPGSRSDVAKGRAANNSAFTAQTITLPSDCTSGITAHISASKAGVGTESFELHASVTSTAGVAVLDGPPAGIEQYVHHTPGVQAWSASIDVSGGNARVRLTLDTDVYYTVAWYLNGMEYQRVEP